MFGPSDAMFSYHINFILQSLLPLQLKEVGVGPCRHFYTAPAERREIQDAHASLDSSLTCKRRDPPSARL
jgi:hypothetical protein